MDSQDEDISYTSLLSGNYHLSLVDSPPVPSSNGNRIKKSMRGSNFSIEEDKLLVSGWLNCSLDAIQGTDQKRSTFWEQIVEYFHQHKESTNERTLKSLSHRWSYIQPKWFSRSKKDVPKEKTVIISTPTATSPPTQNVTENEVIELDRPTGRKAEKQKRKVEAKQNEEIIQIRKMKYAHLEESRAQEKEFYRLKAEKFAYDIKAKEEKLRLHAEKMEYDKKLENERLSLQAEKLRIEAEKTELAKKESDERIMMMDVNSMPEIQRSYFEERQREIMRRSRA